MDYKKLFKTAMLAGQIMAQSGAETFRVEDTMNRILRISGLQSVEIYATTTGIVASLSDPTIESISGVRRINNRANNLNNINEVNQISRNLCDGNITVEEALDKLDNVQTSVTYSKRVVAIATIISNAGFAGLFGGGITECLLAALNGVCIVFISRLLDARIGSAFMVDAAKSFAIAFITMIFARYLINVNQEIVIIGSIMPLVPGIPITNAIRDTLQGDYNSGTARAVEAFVISLAIAVGVGAGMGLFHLIEKVVSL